MNIGIGTPARLIDLLNAGIWFTLDILGCPSTDFQLGVLSAEKLERIVVDCSHIDQKKRGILDMKETQRPLIDLLNKPELKSRYDLELGGINLIFF